MEQFLEDGGYTFPVVMDVTGEVFYSYGISAFPTTFMIGADGNVFGYVPGALTGDMMESIVQQTIDGVEAGASRMSSIFCEKAIKKYKTSQDARPKASANISAEDEKPKISRG